MEDSIWVQNLPLWVLFLFLGNGEYIIVRRKPNINLGVVLSQVAAIPGSRCKRSVNDLEVVRTGPNLGGNLVRVFPVVGEFAMFPCACYGFHAMKNKITYLNRL